LVFLTHLSLAITSAAPPALAVFLAARWLRALCREVKLLAQDAREEADASKEAAARGEAAAPPGCYHSCHHSCSPLSLLLSLLRSSPRLPLVRSLSLKLLSLLLAVSCYRSLASRRMPESLRDKVTAAGLSAALPRYLSTSIHLSPAWSVDPLPPDAQKIHAVSPHGQVPYSLALPGSHPAVRALLGRARTVAASATRYLPGLAFHVASIDGVDASREALDAALAAGESLRVAPGGIAEMFAGYPSAGFLPTDEAVLLASRRGFVRLAVERGVPVVPCFAFGSSSLFRRLHLPGLQTLSKLLRASLVLVYGRGGIPFMPFRRPLRFVVGDPIYPPVCDGDRVGIMHQLVCDEMRRLFEENKKEYGWGDRELKIV
jgi:1-acyl-sn-glycerol-3-phosphate acyltransferase